MSDTHEHTDRHAELRDLLDVLRDGDLTDAQVQRLDALLDGDDEARQVYVDYLDLYASLRHYHAAGPTTSSPVATIGPASPPRGRLPWFVAALAAAIAIGATVAVVMLGFDHDPRPTFTESPGVAVITRVVDAEWSSGARQYVSGDTLGAGVVKLDAGVVQVEFYSGATVVVEGPTELDIVSADRAVVTHGKVHASAPPQAHGFTLTAADIDVVDLGTEFAVQVDDAGVAEVHVFDGEVELQDPGRTSPTARSLTRGRGVRLDRSGASTDITPDARRFVSPATLAGLADADSVRRMRTWTRYSDRLRADADVLTYFDFEDQQTWERRLLNRAVGRAADNAATDAPDASIIGAQWAEGRWPGKGALEFKRTSDRVRITVPGQHDAMTFAAWVRFDGFDRWLSSLMLTDGWKQGDPHWQVSWDGEIVLGVNGTGNHFSPPVLGHMDLGRWVHLVTVYDTAARTVRHYLDGRLVGSVPIKRNVTLHIGDAEIGNWGSPVGSDQNKVRNLNGMIDEFVILGRAITDDEVRAMYEAGRP